MSGPKRKNRAMRPNLAGLILATLVGGLAWVGDAENPDGRLSLNPDAAITAQTTREGLSQAEMMDFTQAAQAELHALGPDAMASGSGAMSASEMVRAEASVEQMLGGHEETEEGIARRITERHLAHGAGAGKRWRPIGLAEALSEALENNLTIAQAESQRRQQGEGVRERSAAFLPSFSANLAHDYQDTRQRKENYTHYWRGATTCSRTQCAQEYTEWDSWYQANIATVQAEFPTAPAYPTNGTSAQFATFDSFFTNLTAFGYDGAKTRSWLPHPANPDNAVYWLMGEGKAEIPFNYMKFHKPKPEGYYTSVRGPPYPSEHAKDAPWPDTEATTMTLSVFQPLPWGADISVEQSTVYEDKFWYADGNYLGNRYNNWYESYDRAWTSNLSASLNLPLPWSKYFGRYAVREANLRQALISLRQADNTLQQQINGVLGQVESGYWSLVEAALSLDAVIIQTRNQEKITQRTRRLFDMGKVDQYAMLQMESRLNVLHESEVTSLNQFEQASNQMVLLLNQDRQTLFMPLGYQSLLPNGVQVRLEDALGIARNGHPALKVQQNVIQSSSVNLRQKADQTRLNLSASGSVSLNQSNGSYGFASPEKAWGNTLNPDSLTANAAVALSHPLFNKQARSNLYQARVQKQRQETAYRQKLKEIERDVMNAFTALESAAIRMQMAANSLNLSQQALKKALAYQELRGVTEFEMVSKNNDVLNARTNYIRARVTRKKAEAALLTAMGVMPGRLSGSLPGQNGPQMAAAGR